MHSKYEVYDPIPYLGGTHTYMDEWFAESPTHHFAMSVGHNASLYEKVADLLEIPYVILDK